ncbi:MAG: TlpA family protein disulfide reductase [bacterium]
MDNYRIFIFTLIALLLVVAGGYLIYPVNLSGEESGVKNGPENSSGASGLSIPDDYKHKVTVYWFWGESCPVCARQKPLIGRWANHRAVKIKRFEIENNEDNRQLLTAVAQAYGVQRVAIPATFVGDKVWIGFASELVDKMEGAIVDCTTGEKKCPHPTDKVSPLRLP